MTNKKTLIMGITFIVLVVLGMIGLTYAFFTARVEGNEEASSTIVETADLRLVYDGTAHIEM
ncbi:MAG: hypothetical protein IJB82_00185, partial [Bacilli bacterium]|nr:hypothetical protein [Bacilli bacterium]